MANLDNQSQLPSPCLLNEPRKVQRRRSRLTESQRELLEFEFGVNPYLIKERRHRISLQTGISEEYLMCWFKNRRGSVSRRARTRQVALRPQGSISQWVTPHRATPYTRHPTQQLMPVTYSSTFLSYYQSYLTAMMWGAQLSSPNEEPIDLSTPRYPLISQGSASACVDDAPSSFSSGKSMDCNNLQVQAFCPQPTHAQTHQQQTFVVNQKLMSAGCLIQSSAPSFNY